MLKRFFYLLAFAFVLQMSAGVASAYCMHESGQASEHFGHHQHQHESAAGDDDEDGSSAVKKLGADPDCAACSHSSSAMFSWAADMEAQLVPSHHQPALVLGWPSPYLDLPERPNWNRAA